jgi:transposase
MGGGTELTQWQDFAAQPGSARRSARTTLARMLSWSSGTRVFVATQPVDLRASFNRLFALTQSVLQQDPLSGHWFVFTNQERNRVKVLFWDGSGLWVCAKRLEQGRFSWPKAGESCARLRTEELLALLSGLEVKEKAGWYRR